MAKVLYLTTNKFISFTNYGNMIYSTQREKIIDFLIENQDNLVFRDLYLRNNIEFPLLKEELEIIYD